MDGVPQSAHRDLEVLSEAVIDPPRGAFWIVSETFGYVPQGVVEGGAHLSKDIVGRQQSGEFSGRQQLEPGQLDAAQPGRDGVEGFAKVTDPGG
jgi:hypothetical protein